MEAATLKAKKQIKKGKLKKTMKNVICRPDPSFWPQTSEDEGKTLIEELNKLKVDIPDFKKPLWKEISHIPKELRPKPPPIPKVKGLIFGIAECQKAIETKECIGVLVETAVNPKNIVQPLIDICTDKSVPVLCLKELRSNTKVNFGIPTTVLGVKQDCLPDLERKIIEISSCHRLPKSQTEINNEQIGINTISREIKNIETFPIAPYMYRVLKGIRIFNPARGSVCNNINFETHNFIELSDSIQNEPTNETGSKQYMKMIVNKISSNPNRRKITKVSSKDK